MSECDRKLEAAVVFSTAELEAPLAQLLRIRTKTKQIDLLISGPLYAGVTGAELTQMTRPLFACPEAHRLMRSGSASVVLRKPIHIVALPGSRKEDIWRSTALVDNTPIIKPGATLAVGRHNDWPRRCV